MSRGTRVSPRRRHAPLTGLSPAPVRRSRQLQKNLPTAAVGDPTTPTDGSVGLGCNPFARRYLGYRICFLFLRVLRCFSSPRAPRHDVGDQALPWPGCPIRKSVDHRALAAPYRVSPLGTSFFGTPPLGIHQKPCITLERTLAPHARDLPTPICAPHPPEDNTLRPKPYCPQDTTTEAVLSAGHYDRKPYCPD